MKDLVYQKAIRERLDLIYDVIDNLQLSGQYEKIDDILEDVANTVNIISLTELIGYLTITLPYKKRYKKRISLTEAIKARVEIECPERARALLKGLME